MSGSDDFRKAFGVGQGDSSTGRFRERVGSEGKRETEGVKAIQFVGTPDYQPYGYMPQGTDTCELIWYDTMRQEAREGTFWHYKTLMRVGYSETDPARGGMALVLYLADVNILIEGYHLYPLMERLRSYECAQIEQHSPYRHAKVSPEQLIADGETVIKSVSIDQGMLFTAPAVRN